MCLGEPSQRRASMIVRYRQAPEHARSGTRSPKLQLKIR
jgi:hypothetical protein